MGVEEQGAYSRGDISHLLFVTAKPGIQALWFVLVFSTLVYSAVRHASTEWWAVAVMLSSFLVVMIGNHFFPFDSYRPLGFFGLMCASLVLIWSLVYLTGNSQSLMGFLFFSVPIFAAAYYGYLGTALVTAMTAVARCVPFFSGNVTSIEILSIALTITAYFIVGFLACYVVYGEKLYARESSEYRRLLELSRDREREASAVYDLSRRFSYTLDLDTILKTVAALARKMLSSEGALVFLSEEGRMVLKASLGALPFTDLSAVSLPIHENWIHELSMGKDTIAEKVSLSWLPLTPGSAAQRHNLAAVPLLTGGEVTGYLICFSPAPRKFRESHLEILSTLAAQASTAVEKADLYSRTVADKSKVETILSALRDGLLVTDSNGVLVQLNPVSRALFDLEDDAIGRNIIKSIGPAIESTDFGDMSAADALETALDGRPVFGEIRLKGQTGATLQANFIPLKGRIGEIAGVVLFLHDITELKHIDEMKSNFVSNVSHELRTPLTSISGFVSLLLAGRAGSLTMQQEKYLTVVKQQTQNLTKLIENLLDLSRLRAKGVDTVREPVDISDVVEAATRHLRVAALEKDISMEVTVPSDLPPAASETGRMTQVVTNILENALKFSPPGQAVKVSAHLNGELVQVQIQDNGPGIPTSDQPQIFDRFFQAHPAGSSDQGGFGLGLAICKELIEQNGGNIWVESEPGSGSTFYFTVPAHLEPGAGY